MLEKQSKILIPSERDDGTQSTHKNDRS
jgi:hypothetical protein